MSKEINETETEAEAEINVDQKVDADIDTVAENDLEETGRERPSAEVLSQSLQESQDALEEQRNQVLRMQAELENTRRRAERDVQAAHKFALEKFVNELLPVMDSLEMGEIASRGENADLAKVGEGMALTLKMFADVMGKFGVAAVDPTGQPFNPDLHQAMSMQDVPDAKPNTIVTVFQKGYQLNERLVRPAMVVVASAKSGSRLSDEPPGESSLDEMA